VIVSRTESVEPVSNIARPKLRTMQLARRGSHWSVEQVNCGADFDAHGDESAPRTDQARNV